MCFNDFYVGDRCIDQRAKIGVFLRLKSFGFQVGVCEALVLNPSRVWNSRRVPRGLNCVLR